MLRRLANAPLILAFTLGAASPAFAGRGTQINDPLSPGFCTLGSDTCDKYVNISSSGVFSRAYIYQEGIVSIDALLPTNWDPANPSTYGSGVWFTPGYSPGTTYQVNAYFALGFDTTPDSW